MDDLIAWLRGVLDEEEQEARRHPDDEDSSGFVGLAAEKEGNYPCSPYLRIAKVTALADIAAKRAILDLHGDLTAGGTLSGATTSCPICRYWAEGVGVYGEELPESYPCPTVRALALPYAEWSGYRDEWRP